MTIPPLSRLPLAASLTGLVEPLVPGLAKAALTRVGDESAYLAACVRRGLITPQPPDRLAAIVRGLVRYGTLAGAGHAAALMYADRTAVIDEQGALSYADLERNSNAIANGWLERGLRSGEGVAILARNHRYFLEAFFAAAKVGARVILLNTEFSGPQLRDVAGREGTDLLVHDDEYTEILAGIEPRHGTWRAWADRPGHDTLEWLARQGSTALPPKPAHEAKLIVLTSGTTGTPKGAPRSVPRLSLAPIGSPLLRVPFRNGQTMEVCAPMFHSLGFATSVFALLLGNTLVLRRRFDPAATLASLAERRADSLVVVPVMLQRMLDLGAEAREGLDLSALSVVFVAGSQLGSELCTRTMEAFGPVVYNLYGSTEVAYASIATPEELRVAPSTVGRVLRGTTVRIVDEHGREVPVGTTGRIFVGNGVQFDGYTGGGSKELLDGLMSSGDVGHFDESGLLFIDGRDDEMIVSGGENVFPREVEELLEQHPDVVEVAVLGVPDESFGARLKAFVVRQEGATLDEEAVQEHVRAHLARYKTPREVVFLDELPRNPTGKVLKRELV